MAFVTAEASLFQVIVVFVSVLSTAVALCGISGEEQTLPLILSDHSFFFLINGTPCFRVCRFLKAQRKRTKTPTTFVTAMHPIKHLKSS
jgi:hypothetical protein